MAVTGKDANDVDVSLATEVAGVESGTHRPVHVVGKTVLPPDASTATLQGAGNTLLTSIVTALGTLGTQVTSAAILAKIIAAPATEAKQDTTITALGTLATTAAVNLVTTAVDAVTASLAARFGTLGVKASAGSAPVVLANDHAAVPVSASSLPLPSGATTEATLADGLAPVPPVLGGASAPSANVAITSSSTTEAVVGATGFVTFACSSEPAAGQNGLFIVFGATGVAAATAANGWHIPAATAQTFKFPTGTTWYYRAIRAGSVDAALKFYKSGV